MTIEAILIGLFISLVANAVFSARRIRRFFKEWNRKRILCKFWGKPTGANQNVHIYYPSYPSPKVGRTQKEIGYYLSNDDSKAIEQLRENLKQLGFTCRREMVREDFLHQRDDPFPREGTVILVCGPKLDPTSKQVVYDDWIGGSPASSFFYLKYHHAMNIHLGLNKDGIKEYTIRDKESRDPIHSPMDERDGRSTDRGLLIKFRVDNQNYFLCWGIHSYATLGAVQVALDPNKVNDFPLDEEDILAIVETDFKRESGRIISATATAYPLVRNTTLTPEMKPNPFEVGGELYPETPVFGLSYLWATQENVDAIKEGSYAAIRPVAAELDLSLECIFNCPWCPYSSYRPGKVIKGQEDADAIVDELGKLKIKLLVLTGGGEPLKSPCVKGVVERAINKDMIVTLYTNGCLLDDSLAYDLMSKRISEIRISLDDISSEDAYLAIHGLHGNSDHYYEKVKTNTRKLLELREKNGFDTRIGVSFLASDKTLPNLEQSINELEKWLHGVAPFDYVVIRPPVNYYSEHISDQYFTDYKANFPKIIDAGRLFKKKGVARHALISQQRFRDVCQPLDSGYKICRASNLWLNIGPDSLAYLCCETKHNEEAALGNIVTDDIETILTNPIVKRQRNRFFGAGNCPTRLCKPSMLNLLFERIEENRDTEGKLPKDLCDWLDAMIKSHESETFRSSLIPSVSGLYKEFKTNSL